MSGWSARLAVLSVFALGCLTGGVAVHLCRVETEKRVFFSEAPVAQLIVFQLDDELDLSAEQERQVREVLLQMRADSLPQLRAELLPRFVEIFDTGQARIRPILDDEQRAKFDRIAAERRRTLER